MLRYSTACVLVLIVALALAGCDLGQPSPESDMKKTPEAVQQQAEQMDGPELQSTVDRYKAVITSKQEQVEQLLRGSVEKAKELLTGGNVNVQEEVNKLKNEAKQLGEELEGLQERFQVYLRELGKKK